MEKSSLIPFVRHNLDILFVGLNPATGSSRKGHYFSVNKAFWNQLFDAGLITERVDKEEADELVFGSTKLNCNRWQYGITDLLPLVAESDSGKMKPTEIDCRRLVDTIANYSPKTVVLLHSKVVKHICRYLHITKFATNCGHVGSIIIDTKTEFFNIAFPHGNTILTSEKVDRYVELRQFLAKVEND